MTEITLFCSEGHPVGFEACGHTDYADQGEDLVCCAVSVLTQTAIIGLTEHLNLKCAYETEDGYAYCMLPESITDPELHDAETILETMALGMRSIADSYGDYIKLIEREV